LCSVKITAKLPSISEPVPFQETQREDGEKMPRIIGSSRNEISDHQYNWWYEEAPERGHE
jgi:hypothetical protein